MYKLYKSLFVSIGLLAIVFFVLSPSLATAQSELLFGQTHHYSVYFRGNGEAIVYARISINNQEEKPLSEVSFQIPQASVTEFVAFQKKSKTYCAEYDYKVPGNICLRYEEYFDSASDLIYQQGEYQKISVKTSGNYYTLMLPSPIPSSKSGMVIVSYAAHGYVKNQAGLFKFNFETFQVPNRVQEVRVAVDVDPDYQLKGKRSQVNYQTDATFAAPASGLSSEKLDYVGSRIGSYGQLMKETRNLAPNESFTVNGEYAKNWFRLYLNSILWTIIVVVIVLVLLYFLFKFLRKHQGKTAVVAGQPVTADALTLLNLTNVGMGLLSAALVTGLTLSLRIMSSSRIFSYVDPFFELMMVLVILMLYVLFLFGPAIFMAAKHGWKSMLSVLIAQFLWLLIFMVIYLVLFQTGLTPGLRNYYDGPLPL